MTQLNVLILMDYTSALARKDSVPKAHGGDFLNWPHRLSLQFKRENFDLAADPSVNRHDVFFVGQMFGKARRIFKSRVDHPRSREHRAIFIGIAADRKNDIERDTFQVGNSFRIVPADINTCFFHCLYSPRIHAVRGRSGAEGIDGIRI